MEYTNITLVLLGVLGILSHNLVKIIKLKKKNKQNFKPLPFLVSEWPSICLSFCFVIACVIAKTEIKKLDTVGVDLGLGLYFIGLGAQSLVFNFLSRYDKKAENITELTNSCNNQEPSSN